ncbi:MAG TPA: CBS domain-containing protein [Candidatus Xenobia bacterium]
MRTVAAIMQPNLLTLPARMGVGEAARLLQQNRIHGALVVLPDGEPVGVLSVADLAATLRSWQREPRVVHPPSRFYHDLWQDDDLADLEVVETPSLTVQDVMNPVVFSIDAAATWTEAVRQMQEAAIHRLMVTGPEGVVGMVTSFDLMAQLPGLYRTLAVV